VGEPDAPMKIIKWLGQEDAPLLFRLRLDPRQWRWGLQFLIECLPSRTRRNTIQCLNLALYSRDCLQELRAQTGIAYDHLERGILSFIHRSGRVRARCCGGRADAAIRLRPRCEKRRRNAVAIEPALAACRDKLAGGIFTETDESGDAQRFTQELARMAQARGVRFRWNMAVESLLAEGDALTGARCVNEEHRKEILTADAYVMALGSYSPFLLKPLGVPCLIYPAKGYSATIAIAGHSGAPTVSLTDLAWKIVFTRPGRSPSRGRDGRTVRLQQGLEPRPLRGAGQAHFRAVSGRRRPRKPAILDGTAAGDAVECAALGRTRYPNLYLDTGHGTLAGRWRAGRGARWPI
jgi:D-amino-acid dehydrogenase